VVFLFVLSVAIGTKRTCAAPILRFLPYGKFEIQLKENGRRLWCGRNDWHAMLRIIASKHDVLRLLAQKQSGRSLEIVERPPHSGVVSKVRASNATQRLLRHTVPF